MRHRPAPTLVRTRVLPPPSSRRDLGAWILLAVALCLALVSARAASADDDLNFFEELRLQSDASNALEAGDFAAASEHYARLAAGSNGDRRAESLYFRTVAELSKERDERDEAAAREALDQFLAEFPRHEKAAEARVLAQFLEERSNSRDRLEEILAQAERQVDQRAEADNQVESLESKVERLGAELAATRAELKKKEEALEKLKQVVIGGDG